LAKGKVFTPPLQNEATLLGLLPPLPRSMAEVSMLVKSGSVSMVLMISFSHTPLTSGSEHVSVQLFSL